MTNKDISLQVKKWNLCHVRKPLAFFIAARYLTFFGRKHFIGFISMMSMLGIALGVTVLITVLSVMNGFLMEIQEKLLELVPHMTLHVPNTLSSKSQQEKIFSDLEKVPFVKGYSLYLEKQAVIYKNTHMLGVLLKGVYPNQIQTVSPISERMIIGDIFCLQADTFNILIGSDLADHLKVGLGDKLTILLLEGTYSIVGFVPQMREVTIGGIFEFDSSVDSNLAVMHLQDLQALNKKKSSKVTGIQLALIDPFQTQAARHSLKSLLNQGRISDWTEQHRHYFQALKMQKTTMFLVLLLIVAIATFNLVSTLMMVVTKKQPDIAVLRSLGADKRLIVYTFLFYGLILGGLGIFIGTVLGVYCAHHISVWASALERLFGMEFVSSQVYYIDFLPSRLLWSDVYLVALAALGLCFVATVYPAFRASRLLPARVLRHV